MQASTYISSFYIAKLAQAVSSPFTSMEAYRSGVIDASGNITKPESSIDPFEYLVIKLKKIFEQLPYGTTKAQLSNYMSTLNLFTEQASPELEMFLEGVVSSLDINEDTAIAGGGGAPGSLGTPSASVVTGGIVGFDPVMAVGLKKKQPPKYFKDCEIFDVCPEEMASFKAAKQWKDVPDSETKTYLQRFQRRNKNAKIGVRGLNPVSGDQDLYWITYPSKNFLEDVDLSKLSILFEETDYSQQFRDQLSSLFKKVQETKSSNKKNKNASVAELNARIFNHINNFTKIKSNSDALRHYMEHEGVKGILGNPDSNSSDTHIITGFDEKNLPIIKTFDVKNLGSRGKRKNVYIRQHLSSEEISQVEQHSPNNAWVTERIQPKGLQTSDRLYKKGTGVTQRLAKAVADYLGQSKTAKDSLLKKLRERAQSKEYMIHENGRFYLANHSHFDIGNPEVSANFGTPTYRTEGKRKQGASYVDPHENLRLARGQASIRAGLKDTFRDENNRVKLDNSGLKDIESMLDDETKKHFSDFVKTYN